MALTETHLSIIHTCANGRDRPILKLNDDLLWEIFRINADMEEEAIGESEQNALDTLRYSSQVCSNWRQLILSSSSLWGQIMNVTSLTHRDWREEVLRRTGKSLLCILGSNRGGRPPANSRTNNKVALGLIDRYWTRIQSLELDFTDTDWADCGYDVWSIFGRPSPVLERFRVMLLTYEFREEIHTPLLSDTGFAVFGNAAPALRVFYAPNIAFSLTAPWLVHLRFLSLNGLLSAYDLLRAIAHMPFLECLADENSNAVTRTGGILSETPVPSLNWIAICSFLDIRPYLDLLAHIKPTTTCSLAFVHSGAIPDAETLDSVNRILKIYSRRCNLVSGEDIYLTLSPILFALEVHFPSDRTFRFEIDFPTVTQDGDLPNDGLENLFNTLPPLFFPDANLLTLELSPFAILPSHPKVAEFILAASSVQFLFTTVETLAFLLSIPIDILDISFPLLQKVELSSCPTSLDETTISKFLELRIGMGKQVCNLDIVIASGDSADLRYLDAFSGLEVTLRLEEDEVVIHRCGDGCVEDLFIVPRI
ncbi:hypothetical protein GALMADRAFT_256234 [Galerina marginata CBS 339.88]|uniref:F-box domain-containing protein n=1 Tax=Galerina marginata (strain CBS 339.88) TaxID=685588 RepID=A0A067SQG5_GALM3|nr:hypothetical protein GALMADRAFT_256234 [Galerina marginata CBS 339.88]